MWLAGIVLFGLLAGISLAWPEARETDTERETTPDLPPELIPEKDRLFDVLSLGAVVATVALVLYFF